MITMFPLMHPSNGFKSKKLWREYDGHNRKPLAAKRKKMTMARRMRRRWHRELNAVSVML